jgi:hypothetical protein
MIALFDEGMWLRQDTAQGYAILHAGAIEMPDWRLDDVMVLFFDPSDSLIRRIDAGTALLKPDSWQLHKAVSNVAGTPSENMEIYTNTDKIMNARKQNLELILANHNKDCDNCSKNSKCELQKLSEKYDIEGTKHKTIGHSFRMDNSSLYLDNMDPEIVSRAQEIARKYHPAWNNLSHAAKKLMTRNTFQILGYDLNTPVSFVVCWTLGGKIQGGTGQALRIAKDMNIPIFNLYNKDCLYKIKLEINK